MYQRCVWGVIRRLPFQRGLRFVYSHTVEVPWRQPRIGNHFHHSVVRGRTQEGRDRTHLKTNNKNHDGSGPMMGTEARKIKRDTKYQFVNKIELNHLFSDFHSQNAFTHMLTIITYISSRYYYLYII